jgi:hypothetical protein
MGADQAPAVLLNAGKLLDYPEIDYPWPIKVVALVAIAWILLRPISIFLAVRRGRWTAGVTVYACGALVMTGFWLALMWGWPFWVAKTEGLPTNGSLSLRYPVILLQMGSFILGIGTVLAAIATLAGHLSARWGKRLPARQAGG